MPAVTNGAELLRRLKKTGTPDQRMRPGRAELLRVKAERNEVANSAQVIAALERAYGPGHMTVVKARAIAERGEYAPPPRAVAAVAVEDELLADALAPVSQAAPDEPAPRKGRVRRVVQSKKPLAADPVTA